MPVHDMHEDVILRVTFTDVNGQPFSPAVVTCTVTDPGGVVSTPSVYGVGGGVYEAIVTPDKAGRWVYTFTASGQTDVVESGTFVVRGAGQFWTYSGDPSSSALDEVRFLCGDTNEDDPALWDAEILYLANRAPTRLAAAADACDAMASRYARMVDRTVGTLSVAFSQKYRACAERAAELRGRAGTANIAPSDPTGLFASPDHTSRAPVFSIGMHDRSGS